MNVGRTGKATPFAVLEPVAVAGVTITNATLHNEIQVLAKDVRVGDTVIVRRAGDVIPEVVGSVKDKRPKGAKAWRMPAACPACGQPLVRPEGEGHHFCENVDCPSRIAQSLIHLASRGALDIEGLGEKTVTQFRELGWLDDLADVFQLHERRDELLALPGLEGPQRRQAARRHPGRGAAPARAAARGAQHPPRRARRWPRTWPATCARSRPSRNAPAEQIAAIDGIGPTIAAAVRAWFDTPRNAELAGELVRARRPPRHRPARARRRRVAAAGGCRPSSSPAPSRSARATRPRPRSRRWARRSAAACRPRPPRSIAGDEAGTKLDKAKEKGVPVLDEAALGRLLDGAPLADVVDA